MTKKLKFEDFELVELHKKGLNDVEISKIFKCSRENIRERRYKLLLMANSDTPPFNKLPILNDVGMRIARLKSLIGGYSRRLKSLENELKQLELGHKR